MLVNAFFKKSLIKRPSKLDLELELPEIELDIFAKKDYSSLVAL